MEEHIQMPNKHMKRYSTLAVTECKLTPGWDNTTHSLDSVVKIK